MKGWIALDIDGTLTDKIDSISDEVVSCLRSLKRDGWGIIILTGRSLKAASNMISSFDFPFVFSSQNGASAWYMPEKKRIFKKYLKRKNLKEIEDEVKKLNLLMLVWDETQNVYMKKDSNKNFLPYYYKDKAYVSSSSGTNIKYIDHFENFSEMSSFPFVKCIGFFKDVEKLKNKLKEQDVEISLVKDPFEKDFYMLLVTDKGVSKGTAISYMLELHGKSFVIAAGNDGNDLPMYNFADIKIAMEDAPLYLVKEADIIASSAKKKGIIPALEKAVGKYIVENVVSINS